MAGPQKGQSTLPLEARRRWGIKAKDIVTIQAEDDVVTLTPARSALETIYQSVPALSRPLPVDEMTELAAEEHAQPNSTPSYQHECAACGPLSSCRHHIYRSAPFLLAFTD